MVATAPSGYDVDMTRDEIIARIRAHEPELRRRGVAHAALFGSVARGEAGPDSDVDVMVDIDPDVPVGIFQLADMQEFLVDVVGRPVDLVTRRSMKERVLAAAERDRVDAF